jgi:poly-gamma-glutamate synthesis protein (capsule biosynthesis protein)
LIYSVLFTEGENPFTHIAVFFHSSYLSGLMFIKIVQHMLSGVSKPLFRFFSRNRFILAFPVALFLWSKPFSIGNESDTLSGQENGPELTLLFIGDIMQHMPQVDAAWNPQTGVYCYDSCFRFVRPVIENYDLAIANFETTLAGKPYSGYPAFSSPDELVQGIQCAGIDIVGTANNHCCDRGRTGLERTVKMMDSLGLMHLGTYRTEQEYRKTTPMIIRKNGISIALLNYTYGTNGISVPEGDVVSLIEKDRILRDLKAAQDARPDKIILFMHWGDEYQQEPNAYQKDIANFCFDHGADIIIGSHPHVIQPMEWHKADSVHKERLVVWSLGNYVSNQRKRFTDGGSMFSLTLKKEQNNTYISNANYQLCWVYNPLYQGKRQYFVLPVNQFEQDSGFLDPESYNAMKAFAADSRELLKANIGITEIQ